MSWQKLFDLLVKSDRERERETKKRGCCIGKLVRLHFITRTILVQRLASNAHTVVKSMLYPFPQQSPSRLSVGVSVSATVHNRMPKPVHMSTESA